MDDQTKISDGRLAPVQGYSAGIPWSMHLRAYDAYCKKYGKQQSLIQGDCRGGFGTNELDDFIPGWREELSELAQLREEVKKLREACQKATADLASCCDLCACDPFAPCMVCEIKESLTAALKQQEKP